MLFTCVDEITEEQSRTTPGANLKTWQIPQCPFLIECSPEVLDQIRREVETGRDLRGGERETGGVLFGIEEPGRIRILSSQPLPCEHEVGPGFILSQKDERRLAQVIADAKPHNGQALGWYHSHLRSSIFLSERDRQIHTHYFPAARQVALVVRAESERPLRAGFFFQESSGAIRTESAYEEFTIEAPPPQEPPPELEEPAISKQPRSPRRRPSPAKPEPPRVETVCPRCGGAHLRRSRRTGPIERLSGIFGFFPYRCHECLSRSFLRTSAGLLERARAGRRKRPEERKRAWQRTRREILLWGGGILGFLFILYYLIRDTGPKQDQ